MASAKDTAYRALNDDITGIAPSIARMFGYESDAETQAKKLANERVQNSRDNLEFQKGVDSRNQSAIDSLYSQIFGTPMPSSQAATSAPAAGVAAPSSGVAPTATAGYDPNQLINIDTGSGTQQITYQQAINQGLIAPPPTPQASPTTTPDAGPQPTTPTKSRFQTPNSPGSVTPGLLDAIQGKQQSLVKPWSLPGVYSDAEREQGDTVSDLISQLNSIKDPTVSDYGGDVKSEVGVSPETLAAQQFAMDKLKSNTDVKETAEEKLMREVARRDMEGQMKGDRDAMAQQLKSRGVYGSGAELASQLGSQSETASRRALEELAAQANAQKRAMDALGQYSTAGIQMGQQDLTAGRYHDLANEFNANAREQHNQFVTKQQADANQAKQGRAVVAANAKTNATQGKVNHANDLTNVMTQLTGMRVGANNAGGQAVSQGYAQLDPSLGTKAAEALANDNSSNPLTRLI